MSKCTIAAKWHDMQNMDLLGVIMSKYLLLLVFTMSTLVMADAKDVQEISTELSARCELIGYDLAKLKCSETVNACVAIKDLSEAESCLRDLRNEMNRSEFIFCGEDAEDAKSNCVLKIDMQTYTRQCEKIDEFHVRRLPRKDRYQVGCHSNYHHYNERAYQKYYKKDVWKKMPKDKRFVRIGNFNMLHPVNGKTKFKNIPLLAEIIDKEFDVMAGIELVHTTNEEYEHNIRLQNFLNERDDVDSATRKQVMDSYILPGFIKILDELRKRDPSWALIVSPRAEAAKTSDTRELTGYYYRATHVRPRAEKGSYCSLEKVGFNGNLYGCVPWFLDEERSIRKAFSRRPFMTDFEAGDFKFTLLASHIVYNSPNPDLGKTEEDVARIEENMAEILEPAFGVTSYEQFEPRNGVTKANYARLSELRLIVDFMQELRTDFAVDNIILVGDFNIEYDNKFWDTVLEGMPGARVFIDEKTSVSVTKQYSKDFDHVVFDPEDLPNCMKGDDANAGRIDFFTGYIKQRVEEIYNPKNAQQLLADYYADLDAIVTPKGVALNLEPFYVEHEKDEKDFMRRVIDSQSGKKKYNVYKEVLSDHVPIYLYCEV
jgi:hypothetical protein